MAYAKTSLRGEQRALREEMRALGMSHRQIAVEFALQYRLRPRAAWRHAHGWSLTEASQQINAYAARRGLRADGVTQVAMTAAHLSEYENWPGVAREPTGRRPTPYLLSLLAAVYGCTVHDLLDVADYRRMPASDRLILDKTSQSGDHDVPDTRQVRAPGNSGDYPGSHAAPRPLAAEVAAPASGTSRAEREQCSQAGVFASLSAASADDLMIEAELDALTAYERQFGGGNARAYAMDYLHHIVQPRLRAAAGRPGSRELYSRAVEFSLRVASMHLDGGDARASRGLLAAGLPLAQETGSPVMVAWVLARFGELDIQELNLERALAYTSGAAAMVERSSPRARSFILAKHALAVSMTGDRVQTLAILGRAQDGFGLSGGDAEPGWMRFYGPEHLRHDEARCLSNLGMGDDAVRAGEESMRGRRLSRPRAFSLAVQAISHLRSKDNAVDRACEVGSELAALAGQLASDRVNVGLAQLLTALRPYHRSPAVQDLAEAARPVLGGSPG
jgi:hypothetical protein